MTGGAPAGIVARGEFAAAAQRNPEHVKVAGHDALEQHDGPLAWRNRRLFGDLDGAAVVRVQGGQRLRERHAAHVRQGCDARCQVVQECQPLQAGVVARGRQSEPQSQQIGGLKSGIDAVQAREALEQKRRANQQHHRKGNLSGHQEGTRREAAARRGPARAGARFAQHIRQVRPRGVERGEQAEQNSGRGRERHGEGQHQAIEPDLAGARKVDGVHAGDGAESPFRQHDAQRTARGRQHQALGEQLGDEPGARSPQSRPHGEFARARRGAGQQQACHVGAGDQQDETHRAEQRPEHGAHVGHKLVPEPDHAHGGARIHIAQSGMGRGILVVQDVELRARLVERDLRLQPGDADEDGGDVPPGRLAAPRTRPASRPTHPRRGTGIRSPAAGRRRWCRAWN